MAISDARITTKIALVIGVMALLVVGTNFYALQEMGRIDSGYSDLINREATAVIELAKANRLVVGVGRQTNKLIVQQEEKYMRQAMGAIERFAKDIRTFLPAARAAGPAWAGDIAGYERLFEEAMKDNADIVPLALANKDAEALTIINERFDPKLDRVRDGLADLVDKIKKAMDQQSVQATAATRAAETTTLAAALLGLLAVGGFSIGMARSTIAKPLAAMTTAMLAVARGQLDTEVPARGRRDEVGQLAGALETFKANALENRRLQAEMQEHERRALEERKRQMSTLADQFEASVKTVASQVATAANQLQANAQALSSMAEQSRTQCTAVAASTDETAANVQTVAASAEEMASSIGEISRQVGQSASIARSATDKARDANTSIQTLADQAQRIGEVVELINSIASQTNLLALNATIEAARAGEAGKGFAVVASEVKSLANQTAKATEDISAQIAAMQQATAGSVAAITEITRTIADINQIATAIAAAIEEQDAATREIARNVQQAAQGTQEISSNIAGVQRAAEGTGKAAAEVLEASRDLIRDSGTLSSEVDRFIRQVRTA